jgi:Hint domain
LLAPNVTVEASAEARVGGSGGAGGTEASDFTPNHQVNAALPGPVGMDGTRGTPGLDMVNNDVRVGRNSSGPPFAGDGQLTLQLSIVTPPLLSGTVPPPFVPLYGGKGGNLSFFGNHFTGLGHSTLSLTVAGGGVTVDAASGNISINGSPNNALSGFDTFDLDNGDTFIAGSMPATVNLMPDADTIIVTPTSANVTVNQVTANNLILDFAGFGAALGSLDQVLADMTQSAGTTTISLPTGAVITLDTTAFTPSASTVNFNPECFRAGTRIMTGCGEVPVEALRVGDRVITAGGDQRPVRLIGSRRIDCRRHPRPDTVMPIRIAAHAFGHGLPGRDLFLSPDHAIFAEGVLIPVRHLINGRTITRIMVDSVTYHHVELDEHDVLLAEGMPAESYLDTGARDAFSGSDGAIQLYADFRRVPCAAPLSWETRAYAPLMVVGIEIDRVRARLARPTTTGPGMAVAA